MQMQGLDMIIAMASYGVVDWSDVEEGLDNR